MERYHRPIFDHVKNKLKAQGIEKFYITKPTLTYDDYVKKTGALEKSPHDDYHFKMNDIGIEPTHIKIYEVLPNGVLNTVVSRVNLENGNFGITVKVGTINPPNREITLALVDQSREDFYEEYKQEGKNIIQWLESLKEKEDPNSEKTGKLGKKSKD